ncbi:MAG: hypothetical protein WCA00_15610, partial [Candidatus Acidiferrales bacterium]
EDEETCFLTTLDPLCSALIRPQVRTSEIHRPIRLSGKFLLTRLRLRRKRNSAWPIRVQELLAAWIVRVSPLRHRIGDVAR